MNNSASHLCNHLEEGKGDDLLRDVDHLVEADGDGAGVVVGIGQQAGGQGHVRAGLPVRFDRRIAMLHVGCTCLGGFSF